MVNKSGGGGAFKEAFSADGRQSKASQEEWERLDQTNISGICEDPQQVETCPRYIQTSTEKLVQNDHGACIVFGRDRYASRASGYGGRGDTQCASIDICVGRMGANAASYTGDDQPIWANPDFRKDAARIYISQKTDIDKNFGLCEGEVGSTPTRSGIALKADGIRLVAREGIKLITRTDSKNSQGGSVQSIQGIDIIAGNNDEDLQPMVKGSNLSVALEKLSFHVWDLAGIVVTLLKHQMTLNKEVTSHQHFSPFCDSDNEKQLTTRADPVYHAGRQTAENHLSQTMESLSNFEKNVAKFPAKYLTDKDAEYYINSRYNNTN